MGFDFGTLFINGKQQIVDEDWSKNSFLVGLEDVDQAWTDKLYYSSADSKFTDSSWGGSFACNAKTQFTRTADMRRKGRRKNIIEDVTIGSQEWSTGMGTYYSEAFDDNSRILWLECGVPKFRSLWSFLTTAVDMPISEMAKHASGSQMYDTGKFVGGLVGTFVVGRTWVMAATTVAALKFAYTSVFPSTAAKYYFLKPAMHVYWNVVNNLSTHMAIELGILQPTLGKSKPGRVGNPLEIDQTETDRVNGIFGDILSSNGYIDVRMIVNRANSIVTKQVKEARELDKKANPGPLDWYDYYTKDVQLPSVQPITDFISDVLSGSTLYTTAVKKTKELEEKVDFDSIKEALIDKDGGVMTYIMDELKKEAKDLKTYFDSAMTGGARYAAFEVEYMGEETTTFSNSVKDIPSKGALNGIGGASRDIKFISAGGNVVGDAVNSAVMGLLDLAQGALHTITFGGSDVLVSLLGGGFVDMPKMWDDSSISAKEYNFKMRLSSPYNHPMSALQKKWVPLFMIMAATLPLSTGKASYVSPFLVNAFMRGRVNIDLGIVTNLTVTKYVGSTSQDAIGQSLALDVSFTITDLTTMLSAPVSSFAFSTIVNPIDEDSALGRFLSSLGGRDIYTDKYHLTKAKMRLTGMISDFNEVTDPAFLQTMLGDNLSVASGLFIDDISRFTRQAF